MAETLIDARHTDEDDCQLVAIVVIGMCSRKPLTVRGAETRDHLLGLKEFIAWAEADRIRMLQSPSGAERVPVDVDDPRQKLALYEKLLPYAVVFGQEKEWSRQLAVLYTAVVSYPRLFPMYGLVGMSNTVTLRAATVLRNQPFDEQDRSTETGNCT